MRLLSMLSTVLVPLAGCTGVPDGVQPVTDFELERYLGTWYEIARLDHFFERGLSKVTAEYSMRDDGMVRVVNRGYSAEDREWKDRSAARGRRERRTLGPFFWPSPVTVSELDHGATSTPSCPAVRRLYLHNRIRRRLGKGNARARWGSIRGADRGRHKAFIRWYVEPVRTSERRAGRDVLGHNTSQRLRLLSPSPLIVSRHRAHFRSFSIFYPRNHAS